MAKVEYRPFVDNLLTRWYATAVVIAPGGQALFGSGLHLCLGGAAGGRWIVNGRGIGGMLA